MKKIVAMLVLLLVVGLSFLPQKSPLRKAWRRARGQSAQQHQPVKPELDEDTISAEFLQEAWIVLLPVTRQKPDDDGNLVGVGQADAAMSALQGKAKTRSDWLIYSQISDYSLAKLLQTRAQGRPSPQVLRDPDECVSATMAAMRNRVLHARLAACEQVRVTTPVRR